MNRPARPSLVLEFYYGFLLLSTALAHGLPYPLFGVVLEGGVARAALVFDCLWLIHILLGILRAQYLTWWLILGYNGFNLASLAVTVALLDRAGFVRVLGQEVAMESLYLGLALSAVAMVMATAYAVRCRALFWNRNPYLF